VRCDAYCQMANHFHLLIRLTDPNLSRGMQWLNGLYAQVFNGRHGLCGHLFQGRFHAALVEDDGHLLELARYIVLNPVRAGLCDHPLEW
jgi:putative transposase